MNQLNQRTSDTHSMASISNRLMLRETLNKLSLDDKRQLMYALEEGMAQFVELENKRFIGVYVECLTQLEILESVGAWSYGKIR